VGGEHRRLPDLSFLQFAVAEEREGATVFAGETGGQRVADGDRQALAKRAADHVHGRGPLSADLETIWIASSRARAAIRCNSEMERVGMLPPRSSVPEGVTTRPFRSFYANVRSRDIRHDYRLSRHRPTTRWLRLSIFRVNSTNVCRRDGIGLAR
jgi:hypothetical protein